MADIPEEAEEEKIFNISISPNRGALKNERARRAVIRIKEQISRHMKAEMDKVWLDPHVNEFVWGLGGENIPSRVRVKAIKFEDGLVEVSLPKE